MTLNEFRPGLEALESEAWPLVLTASFDLRPGMTGQPTAPMIVREAIRANPATDGWSEGQEESLTAALTDAIEAAIGAGATGIFIAGPADEPTRLQAVTSIPPRHALTLSDSVDWFELERHAALTRPVVASVWADRSSVQSVIVRQEGEPLLTQIEADTHHMERSTGRTAQHGRVMAAGVPAGGHGKTRIEESAEEERERFAREAAALLERRLEQPDAIILQGPPEFGARLVAELSPQLRERIVSDGQPEDRPEAREQARQARERAVILQHERARELHDEIVSGALGERALAGPVALLAAAREGRLATLVLDEDAVGHFGDALDARRRAPTADAARIAELLRAAREQAAVCWFAPSDAMSDVAGAAGTLRW